MLLMDPTYVGFPEAEHLIYFRLEEEGDCGVDFLEVVDSLETVLDPVFFLPFFKCELADVL